MSVDCDAMDVGQLTSCSAQRVVYWMVVYGPRSRDGHFAIASNHVSK